jgi:hypothetical protein
VSETINHFGFVLPKRIFWARHAASGDATGYQAVPQISGGLDSPWAVSLPCRIAIETIDEFGFVWPKRQKFAGLFLPQIVGGIRYNTGAMVKGATPRFYTLLCCGCFRGAGSGRNDA